MYYLCIYHMQLVVQSQSYWVPDPGYQTSCLHCLTVFANNCFDTMVIAHISCAYRAGLCSFPVLPWVADATSTPTLRTGRIHMLSLSSYTLNCLLKWIRHAWWIVLPLLDVRQHESFSHFDEKLSPSEKSNGGLGFVYQRHDIATKT